MKKPAKPPIRAKQTVIVKKAVAPTRAAAARLARRHADRVTTSRETGQSFRFKQRPTGCFIDGTYRTAKLPNGVSIVYGVLKRGAENRKSCKP